MAAAPPRVAPRALGAAASARECGSIFGRIGKREGHVTPQILGMLALSPRLWNTNPQHTRGPCGRARAIAGEGARCPALPLPGGLSPPPRSQGHRCHRAGPRSCPRRAVGAPGGRERGSQGPLTGGWGRYLRERVGSASPESLLGGFFFFFLFSACLGKGYSCSRDAGTQGDTGEWGVAATPGPGVVPAAPLAGGRQRAGRPAGCAAAAERSQPGGERRTSP